MITSSSAFKDSKQHFLILDALRGVAAIMVLIMHTFEIFCGWDFHKMLINHGYLAVDFFFMLSGYVMAHAYDDRWDKMTVKAFFKRRLIRLHPMIILGMTLGAALFFFQESSLFSKVSETSVSSLLLVMVIGYTLIPVPKSMDVRGWGEMHPLNGPGWSLFFEYIANFLHVFILRKLSNLILSICVGIAAIALFYVAITSSGGSLTEGWATDPQNVKVGFIRLLFPYMAGMLLRRGIKVGSGKKTLLLSSILLVVVLSIPRIGDYETIWVNGFYDALVVILVFPVIIYLGAIGEVKSNFAQRVCTFLGDISYPLYITHFPIVMVYFAWVSDNKISIEQGAPVGILLMLGAILVAYASLKLYDLPIRKWLAKRFLYEKEEER